MNKMTLAPKRLFLMDGLGGMISALLLGVVLARFETTFGMPRKVLYLLSCLACVYAAYSFLNYWRMKENWKPYMQGIAIANSLYCCLTIGFGDLPPPGTYDFGGDLFFARSANHNQFDNYRTKNRFHVWWRKSLKAYRQHQPRPTTSPPQRRAKAGRHGIGWF
jgi:hypothetical protein